jgi:hypothetical protein
MFQSIKQRLSKVTAGGAAAASGSSITERSTMAGPGSNSANDDSRFLRRQSTVSPTNIAGEVESGLISAPSLGAVTSLELEQENLSPPTRVDQSSETFKSGSRQVSSPPSAQKNRVVRQASGGPSLPSLRSSKLNANVNNPDQFPLAKFDHCIQAADSLATAAGYSVGPSSRRDARTGLLDCSVLVSPEGNLLFVPQSTHQSLFSSSKERQESLVSDSDNQGDDEKAEQEKACRELLANSADDYEAAMFLGNDLHPAGDKKLNGFSAKGWSVSATSKALEQTCATLAALSAFCDELVATKMHTSLHLGRACAKLREKSSPNGGTNIPMGSANIRQRTSSNDWEIIDPRATDFEMTANRVGPLLRPGSKIQHALAAVEQYHASICSMDRNRWHNGFLESFQDSRKHLERRVKLREGALAESSRKARQMEDQIRLLQKEAIKRWNAVYKAEDKVTKRVEQIMKQRSKEREQRRMRQLKEDEEARVSQDTAAVGGPSTVSAEEIWAVVTKVAETIDESSFEPFNFPEPPVELMREVSRRHSLESPSKHESGQHTDVSLPIASREHIEHEVGLPELRSLAMAADDAVEDMSANLLNV